MKCQAPKSTPAATTLTSTSPGPTSGRATSRKSSTSADPYLSCTIAFIRPHLIAIRPTAPATVVLRSGPRQSRRSRLGVRPRPKGTDSPTVNPPHANGPRPAPGGRGSGCRVEVGGPVVLAQGSQGEAERPVTEVAVVEAEFHVRLRLAQCPLVNAPEVSAVLQCSEDAAAASTTRPRGCGCRRSPTRSRGGIAAPGRP